MTGERSTQAERDKSMQRTRMQRYETDNDIVPGTCSWRGTATNGTPTGGMLWEGASRLAHARDAAGVKLNDRDRDAIRRHPSPRSTFVEA